MMIGYEIRQAIMTLKAQGQGIREISRILSVSRNTVRRVLREDEGEDEGEATVSAGHVAAMDLLPAIYRRCKGNAVRIQEILAQDHAIEIPYSTLTRLIREQDLREPKKRSGIYTFDPGEEMQHDTSPHRVELAGKEIPAQCASLILACSRELYFQYYPAFTRFEAKAFLVEALRFFDGSCRRCTIDNTSVILAGGSGPDALIAPEMEAFGALFGFRFIAHAIGHSDRKGRIERPFSYIEGNFLVCRAFSDWADLNAQALQWCETVANAKPKRVLGMSPQAAYLAEKPHLLPLPPYIPPVTQIHYRVVDTQGYVHLDTNRYSVPERLLGQKVAVHKRIGQVLVFQGQQLVAEHPRLIAQREGVQLDKSHHSDLTRGRTPKGPSPQEQALRGGDPLLERYVAELKKRSPGRGVAKLRRLLELKQSYPAGPFLAAVAQALEYGLFDLARLERLILERVAGDFFALDDEEL
jgi:transposase